MDSTYQDHGILIFIKLLAIIFLIVPFVVLVGYVAIKHLAIYYFVFAFIYGQLTVLISKFILESGRRKFISNLKNKTIKPIFQLDYELKEWNSYVNKIIKEKFKKHAIISLVMLFVAMILISVGYAIKLDGKFALAVGYNILMISGFWMFTVYLFIIYPLQNMVNCMIREVQCYKYGIVFTDSYFILKTFNYVLNVSIENLDNKKYICIKGENRGTNDMGNDTNFITKTYIRIPKKRLNDVDKIRAKAFRVLI